MLQFILYFCPQILWKDQNKQWIIYSIITCIHVVSGGWLGLQRDWDPQTSSKVTDWLTNCFCLLMGIYWQKQVDYWFKCYQRTETLQSFQKLTSFLFLSPLTFSHTGFNIQSTSFYSNGWTGSENQGICCCESYKLRQTVQDSTLIIPNCETPSQKHWPCSKTFCS